MPHGSGRDKRPERCAAKFPARRYPRCGVGKAGQASQSLPRPPSPSYHVCPLVLGGSAAATTSSAATALRDHVHDKVADNGAVTRVRNRDGLQAQRVEGVTEDVNAVVVVAEREVLGAAGGIGAAEKSPAAGAPASPLPRPLVAVEKLPPPVLVKTDTELEAVLTAMSTLPKCATA